MICTFYANGQTKYYTKTAKINFYSKAPLENIEAVNKTATAVIDSKTGCKSKDSLNVGVNIPTKPSLKGKNIVCFGTTNVYTTALNKFHTYSWSSIGGNVVSTNLDTFVS